MYAFNKKLGVSLNLSKFNLRTKVTSLIMKGFSGVIQILCDLH